MAVTRQKAKKILRHGEARGKPLTRRQRGFFGARAGWSTCEEKEALMPTVTQLVASGR